MGLIYSKSISFVGVRDVLDIPPAGRGPTSWWRVTETFRDDLQKASELVLRLYGGLDEARITPAKNRVEIASLFAEPLPEAPQPMEAILREVENNIFANSTLYRARVSSAISTQGEIRRRFCAS
jgi:hypothetical protein